jgi:hypothetical protein
LGTRFLVLGKLTSILVSNLRRIYLGHTAKAQAASAH